MKRTERKYRDGSRIVRWTRTGFLSRRTNGKQRTYVRDMDHGTLREWGSPGGYRIVLHEEAA